VSELRVITFGTAVASAQNCVMMMCICIFYCCNACYIFVVRCYCLMLMWSFLIHVIEVHGQVAFFTLFYHLLPVTKCSSIIVKERVFWQIWYCLHVHRYSFSLWREVPSRPWQLPSVSFVICYFLIILPSDTV